MAEDGGWPNEKRAFSKLVWVKCRKADVSSVTPKKAARTAHKGHYGQFGGAEHQYPSNPIKIAFNGTFKGTKSQKSGLSRARKVGRMRETLCVRSHLEITQAKTNGWPFRAHLWAELKWDPILRLVDRSLVCDAHAHLYNNG